MKFSTYFSKQARKPTGLFGRFFMSRIFEKGNAEINALVKETLAVRKNDRALEIGFGTGMLLKEIADTLADGVIEGIDFSESMIAIARKKNKTHIKTGKVKIRMGDFDELSFDDASFDKIFSVNTIYFWKNPTSTVKKMVRLLKPGGKLVLGFYEKSDMEKMPLNPEVFQYYSTQDIRRLLSSDGLLTSVDVLSKKGRQKPCYCAVGRK